MEQKIFMHYINGQADRKDINMAKIETLGG